MIPSYDKQRKNKEDKSRTNKPKFLCDDRENKVILYFRQKQEFLSALAKAKPPKPTRSNSDKALRELITISGSINKGIFPHCDAGLSIWNRSAQKKICRKGNSRHSCNDPRRVNSPHKKENDSNSDNQDQAREMRFFCHKERHYRLSDNPREASAGSD